MLPCMLWLATRPGMFCIKYLADYASDMQVLARLYAVQPAVVAPSSQSTSYSVQHVRGCSHGFALNCPSLHIPSINFDVHDCAGSLASCERFSQACPGSCSCCTDTVDQTGGTVQNF